MSDSWLYTDPAEHDSFLLALAAQLQLTYLVRDGWELDLIPDDMRLESWEWAHDQVLGMDDRKAELALWLIDDGVPWEQALEIARRLVD